VAERTTVDHIARELLDAHPAGKRIARFVVERLLPGEGLARGLKRLGFIPPRALGLLEAAAQEGSDSVTLKLNLLREDPLDAPEPVCQLPDDDLSLVSMAAVQETTPLPFLPNGPIYSEAPLPLEPDEETLRRLSEAETNPPFSQPAELDGSPLELSIEPRPGLSFQNYLLVGRIGEGASSEVWRAYDEELRIDVALKLLKRDPTANRFAESFLDEARRTARLTHPYILRVYRCGAFGRDRRFIATEFIEGVSLGTALEKRGRFLPEQALEVAMRAAAGLEYAAGHGLIHRDVKPRNIMLSPRGELKLIDFGLCEEIDAPSLDGECQLAGSPAYMAPEVIAGRGRPGVSSDIYALGVTLFEMLSGRLPFEATTITEMLKRHLHETPPPIGTRAPGLSRLDGVLNKMLAKNPAERFRSYSQLMEGLSGVWRLECRSPHETEEAWRRGRVSPSAASLCAGLVRVSDFPSSSQSLACPEIA
jgi:serine/threonine protein kinase